MCVDIGNNIIININSQFLLTESNGDKPSSPSSSSRSLSPSNSTPGFHSHAFSISRLHHAHLVRHSSSPAAMPISLTTSPSIHSGNNNNNNGNSSLMNHAHNLSLHNHHQHHHHSSSSHNLSHQSGNDINNQSDNSRSPTITPQSFNSPSGKYYDDFLLSHIVNL